MLTFKHMQAPSGIGFVKLILFLPGLAYLLLVLFALLFGNRLVFPAPPSGYSDSEAIIKFPYDTEGNTVSVLYLDNPGSRYLIYYHHGNGEDLQSVLPRLQGLRRAGFAVLAWDYPGYGTSDGSPSEKLVLQVADQLWETIPRDFGYLPDQVILYGRSLGSGPATWLASRHEAAALILEGAFTSTFRVGIPVKLLPWDIFDNLSRIGSIRCPVLILHGTDDGTIPFSHGRRLYESAPDPKGFTWVQGGKHNDLIEVYPDTYYSSLERFMRSLSP